MTIRIHRRSATAAMVIDGLRGSGAGQQRTIEHVQALLAAHPPFEVAHHAHVGAAERMPGERGDQVQVGDRVDAADAVGGVVESAGDPGVAAERPGDGGIAGQRVDADTATVPLAPYPNSIVLRPSTPMNCGAACTMVWRYADWPSSASQTTGPPCGTPRSAVMPVHEKVRSPLVPQPGRRRRAG